MERTFYLLTLIVIAGILIGMAQKRHPSQAMPDDPEDPLDRTLLHWSAKDRFTSATYSTAGFASRAGQVPGKPVLPAPKSPLRSSCP